MLLTLYSRVDSPHEHQLQTDALVLRNLLQFHFDHAHRQQLSTCDPSANGSEKAPHSDLKVEAIGKVVDYQVHSAAIYQD